MKLTCYLTEDADIEIRPAPARRTWMDQTPSAYAYRCLPLTIANQHGWEICCSHSVEVEWNGGPKPSDLQIRFLDDVAPNAVESRFGDGILTFSPRAIMRTPPGYDLWLTGPANEFKDGIQALSAVIESDWMPYTFSMNWKVTRPNIQLRFSKGDPYCFMFPVQRGVLESIDPEIRDIPPKSDLEYQAAYAKRWRTFMTTVKVLKGVEPEEARFQKWYMRGTLPDGSGRADDHRKSLDLKPFARLVTRGDGGGTP